MGFDKDSVNVAKMVNSGNSHVFVEASATTSTFADAIAKALQVIGESLIIAKE